MKIKTDNKLVSFVLEYGIAILLFSVCLVQILK